MDNNIKNAFSSIYADDKLKNNTALYIKNKLQKQGNRRSRLAKRLMTITAFFAMIILSGAFSYNLYFESSAYVDFDVNPSLELTLNRFDRVIGVYAYNAEGDDILSELSLAHKKYEAAINDLIDVSTENGFLQDDELISITLQAKNTDREIAMLNSIKSEATAAIAKHHITAHIDVYLVSDDMRVHAQEQNISPAKYLAIKELMNVDPTTSFEHCKNHSIVEIKQLTKEHSEHHNNNGKNNNGSYEFEQSETNNTQMHRDHHGTTGGQRGNRRGHE